MVLSGLLEAVGGTEVFLLVTAAGILAGAWVYIDARRRGSENAALWAAAVAFLFLFYALPGLVALIVYAGMRDSLGPSEGGGGPVGAPTGQNDRE